MVLSIRTVRTVTLKDGVVAPLAKKASRTDCACWNGRNSPSLPGSVLPSMPGIKRQFAWVVSTLLVRLSRKKVSISPVPGANMRARSSGVTSVLALRTSG